MSEEKRELNYGGQAVMEGVMMRGSKAMAVAVRQPDGEIIIHTEPLSAHIYAGRISKIPVLRALTSLWDVLVLGIRTLMFSADVALAEEEDVEFSGPVAWGTVAVSFVIAIALFFVGPLLLVGVIDRYIESSFLSNMLEGIIRLVIFVAYIWVIGRVPDIARVFSFHGAEHKTINAYEAGAELTPESAMRFPREHPRCGTAFLLTVVVFSILLFSALGPLPLIPKLLSRLILLPLLAALAYEYIRFTARLLPYRWARPLVAPNLWLQKLTTREPDEKMLEVAIAAFKRMRADEESKSAGMPTREAAAS
jgi:uncharacterized protein YqhQ